MEQQPSLTSEIDDSIPLVFEAGWQHLNCGGPAERAKHYSESYCIKCARTVPSKELGKVLDKSLDSEYNN